MFFKRVAAVLALLLGIAGMAVGLAGVYGVWLVQSGLERANDKVFDAVDRSLKVVLDRVPVVQKQVRDSKITTTEITEAVLKWGARKGQDRIVSQLQIESRVEKLAGHLQATDLKLEASREVVRDVRQLLEVSQSLGVNVNPDATDAVQEVLVLLQDKLQQTEQALDVVRKLTTAADPDEDHKIAKLLARIVLTLSEVDHHLDDFATRLSEVRAEARQMQARTSHYILLGAAVGYGLLAWGLAGQAALCWWGCQRFRPGRLPVS